MPCNRYGEVSEDSSFFLSLNAQKTRVLKLAGTKFWPNG